MNRLVSGHHPSLLWMGGKLVLSLVVVLALFLGAVWVVRQLQRKTRTIRSASRDEIRILQTVVVAPKSTVSVVRVGEESFLLGVTPQTISLLARLGGVRGPEDPVRDRQDLLSEPLSTSRTLHAGGRTDSREDAGPEDRQKKDDRFESVVEEALSRIRRTQSSREGDGGRRWSV
ncbi:flagellar biosynthetic protein FliO [Leptospirillum ferriphilum]|uniref:Flagellar protein n=1 Tax=Leptospirillum ferriphilum YSK TaxID=1441628 RepID=A0A059XS50_9BACT|nr:flagellar biosynthetic protein FliO [Leptospirillum ferriphilum]AIA31419.1 hypothetical protein Y981_01315 [Leptospirillum ferriphilum YSK]